MEKIRLTGRLEYIQYPNFKNPEDNTYKNLFKDESGKVWFNKKNLASDDTLREFVGSNLVNLFNKQEVYSPKIRINKMIEGYFSEFKEWLNNYYDGLRGTIRRIKKSQKQHLIACIINNDFDRNLTNYKMSRNKLFVLDHAGGKGNSKKGIDFGAHAANVSKLIRPEYNPSYYKNGISILRKAMENGYYEEIINELSSEGIQECNEKLISMKENTKNIEDIINEMIKIIRKENG